MNETIPIGFALCCGEPPVVDVLRSYAKCNKCGRNVAVVGSTAFLRTVWNTEQMIGRGAAGTRYEHIELPTPVLFEREGWISCRVSIDILRFGSNDTKVVSDCLFLCGMSQVDMLYAHDKGGHSCFIDSGRHIHDITLEHPSGRQLRLQWKDGKRYPYSYVYATTGYCTDGTFSWNILVNNTRVREWPQLKEWLGE